MEKFRVRLITLKGQLFFYPQICFCFNFEWSKRLIKFELPSFNIKNPSILYNNLPIISIQLLLDEQQIITLEPVFFHFFPCLAHLPFALILVSIPGFICIVSGCPCSKPVIYGHNNWVFQQLGENHQKEQEKSSRG